MKHLTTSLMLALLALPLVARAQTAFTYQGRLTDNGAAAAGPFDFEFRLYTAASGGVQVGSVLSRDDVNVAGGVFTVSLDFGAGSFPGADRFLVVAVRPGASTGAFTTLAPRQQVTPTPYAITAYNFSGSVGAGQLSGTYSNPMTFNNAANSFTGSGAGLTGVNASQLNGQPGAYYLDAGNFTGTLPAGLLANDSIAAAKLANDPAGLARVTGGNATVNGANIGLGTPAPNARLDVRGDIRLGPAGDFFAASSTENARIIRGIVRPDGTIYGGTGFTITKTGTGTYSISFNPAFPQAPALVITAYTAAAPAVANCTGGTGGGYSDISIWVGGAKADSWFNLVAIGSR